MDSQRDIAPKDFFSNAASQDAGFTHRFWNQAYQLYLDEADRDPDPSLEKYRYPRTVQLPFRQGYVDVMIRAQPEAREYVIMRFTAFPADCEGESEVHQIGRSYHRDENRPVLGESALLDENVRW